MWTEERIKELCIEYCERCGVIFDSPVIINGRLKKTLGRCFYKKTKYNITPIKLEFSKQLVEKATDESIIAVIGHECAHYVVSVLTNTEHGHDFVFKHYCKIIGTPNCDGTFAEVEWKCSNDELYKYTIYCAECGEFLCGYNRINKYIKEPERYRCPECDGKIRISKNW